MRRLSVRARTTLVATAVVAVALTLGAFGAVGLLRRASIDGIDQSLRLRARTVGTLANAGSLPNPLPDEGDETAFVQVLDAGGAVVAASGNVQGEGAVGPPLAHPQGSSAWTTASLPVGEGSAFRVLGEQVAAPTGALTVYVAASLAPTERSIAAVTLGLGVGVPLVVVLVGAVVWLVVGRALSPVEAMRREVARISSLALAQRVPEPVAADELQRLAATMNDMLDRLQAADRRQRQFVADASHELRTPVAALRAQLEVAVGDAERGDPGASAADLLEDVDRLQRLTESLLTLSRLDDGAGTPPVGSVDLDEVVLGEVERIRVMTRVAVDMRAVAAARVPGDGEQLRQVVRNLLDNAVRHARSRVEVAVRLDGDEALLSVTDDGPGIAPEDRQRVFERFVRLDAARDIDDGGTGLGLAIVKQIAVAHGGSVAIEGDGAGAWFVVRLPAGAPQGRADDPGRPTARAGRRPR